MKPQEVLNSLLREVREASFGEMDQSELRGKLRIALKAKIAAENPGKECYPYCYITEVFQTFIVVGEEMCVDDCRMRYYKRPYTISGIEVTVGDRSEEVELAWVPKLVAAREAALNPGANPDELTPIQPGSPTPEALECTAQECVASEATGFLAEATFSEGVIEGIVPIKPGTSKNRWYYSEAVLRRDVQVFEGMPVFYDHQDPDQPKPLKNLIGVLENARWDSDAKVPRADLRYPATSEAAIDDIKSKHKLLGGEKVGFSIHMPVKAAVKQIGGKVVRAVEALLGGEGSSTDVVWRPSAGGSFDRALESASGSGDLEMLEGMTLDEIKAARPDLFPAPPAAAPVPPVVTETVQPGVSEDRVAQMVREATAGIEAKIERKLGFEARVREAKVPEKIKGQMLREGEAAGYEASACESIFTDWLNTAAAMAPAAPSVPAGSVQITETIDVARARLDAAVLGEDQEVGGRKVRRFTRVSEAILAFHPELVHQFVGRRTQFARECIGMLHWGGGDLHVRESVNSGTFSNAWADSMYKALEKEYADPMLRTWRELVSDWKDFNDFTNTQKIVRVGDYGDIDTVEEGAPYEFIATPTEEQVEFGIAKYGNLEKYTWESALTDDLSVLARIPRKLGRAWMWKVYRSVYKVFTDNVTMDYDTVALYHSGSHSNVVDAAFSGANLVTACGKMRVQTDQDSGYVKNYRPKFLLYADDEALHQTVWEVLNSSYKHNALSTSGSQVMLPNYIQEMQLQPIRVHYPVTTTQRWELVANPRDVGTLAVGFLNGNERPEIFVQDMPKVGSVFNNDVITFKLRGSFGVDVVNHRSFVRGQTT